MYSCWWLCHNLCRQFACQTNVSAGKFIKCFFSFSALSTFLLLISAPSEWSPSSVITGLQMLIILGWCNTVQDAVGRQQNIMQSFSFKSKDIQRFFFFFFFPSPSSLQCSVIGIHSHFTQQSSYLNHCLQKLGLSVWHTNKSMWSHLHSEIEQLF